MSIDTRIGFAGLIMAFLGIAFALLWPEKKWVGWICLGVAAVLITGWGILEIKHRFGSTQASFWASVLTGAILGGIAAALIWQSTGPEEKKQAEPLRSPTSIRLKYSSRQVLQISNVPGDYNMTLNLDNVATLILSAPFNRDMVTLLWPTSPAVTIAKPRAEEKYKVPGSGGNTVQIPQAGHGLEVQGLTLVGQAQRITFDVSASTRLIRVGDRIFRVSLESLHDKAGKDKNMFLEYEFAISEEDQTAENIAAAVTQQLPSQGASAPLKQPMPQADAAGQLLTALNTQPIGTVTMRLSETADGHPNTVHLSGETKSFLFDPLARVVVFHMKTNVGKSVDLHLPLDKPGPDGRHFIAFAWDNSLGSWLYVNDKTASDGLPLN